MKFLERLNSHCIATAYYHLKFDCRHVVHCKTLLSSIQNLEKDAKSEVQTVCLIYSKTFLFEMYKFEVQNVFTAFMKLGLNKIFVVFFN